MNEILYLSIGLIIGLVIGIILYFYFKSKFTEKESELTHLRTLTKNFEVNKSREIENLKNVWEANKQNEIQELIKQTRKDTGSRQRAVLKGKIGEQLAPLMEEFYSKYEPSDARFIGSPIDYIIFKNLTRLKDEINNKVPPDERSEIEVVIADIKTGDSQLNTEQRKIRNSIQDGRVVWDEIRIDMHEVDDGKVSEIEWS